MHWEQSEHVQSCQSCSGSGVSELADMLACIPSQLQLEAFQLSIHAFSLCVIIIIVQAAVKYEEEAVKTCQNLGSVPKGCVIFEMSPFHKLTALNCTDMLLRIRQ